MEAVLGREKESAAALGKQVRSGIYTIWARLTAALRDGRVCIPVVLGCTCTQVAVQIVALLVEVVCHCCDLLLLMGSCSECFYHSRPSFPCLPCVICHVRDWGQVNNLKEKAAVLAVELSDARNKLAGETAKRMQAESALRLASES